MPLEIQNTQKIILSADSTCDLDTDLKERYHVNYFPLHIILNGKEYRDNVDITPEEVYQEYYAHKVLPKTAAVNAQEYIDHFRPWWRTDMRSSTLISEVLFPALTRTAASQQRSWDMFM